MSGGLRRAARTAAITLLTVTFPFLQSADAPAPRTMDEQSQGMPGPPAPQFQPQVTLRPRAAGPSVGAAARPRQCTCEEGFGSRSPRAHPRGGSALGFAGAVAGAETWVSRASRPGPGCPGGACAAGWRAGRAGSGHRRSEAHAEEVPAGS